MEGDADEQEAHYRQSDRRQCGRARHGSKLSCAGGYVAAVFDPGCQKRSRGPGRARRTVVDGQRMAGTPLHRLPQDGTTEAGPALGRLTAHFPAGEIHVAPIDEEGAALLAQLAARFAGTQVGTKAAEPLVADTVATGRAAYLTRFAAWLAGSGILAYARQPLFAELPDRAAGSSIRSTRYPRPPCRRRDETRAQQHHRHHQPYAFSHQKRSSAGRCPYQKEGKKETQERPTGGPHLALFG